MACGAMWYRIVGLLLGGQHPDLGTYASWGTEHCSPKHIGQAYDAANKSSWSKAFEKASASDKLEASSVVAQGLTAHNVRMSGHVRIRTEVRAGGVALFLLPEDRVNGSVVCFPYSVHKLLDQNSNEVARTRLTELANGFYSAAVVKKKLRGTGVALDELKHEQGQVAQNTAWSSELCICKACTSLKLDALKTPGNYVVGDYAGAHARGFKVLRDEGEIRYEVHDTLAVKNPPNLAAMIRRDPDNFRLWKLSTRTQCEEVVGEEVSLPWTVHKLLQKSDPAVNQHALNKLLKLSKGPYYSFDRDIKPILADNGVDANLKKPESLTSLVEGNYIIVRKRPWVHFFGVHVNENGSFEVYDNQYPGGVGQFSPEDLENSPEQEYQVLKLAVSSSAVREDGEQDDHSQEICRIAPAPQHQDVGRLIVELPFDGVQDNTTWAEVLRNAYPYIQRAIAHQEFHRRSTHWKKPTSRTPAQYHPEFVDDTVPANYKFSPEQRRTARHIYLDQNSIEVFVRTKGLEHQEALVRTNVLHKVLDASCRDGELCGTGEIHVSWSKKNTSSDSAQARMDFRDSYPAFDLSSF